MEQKNYNWLNSTTKRALCTAILLCSVAVISAETYLGGTWKTSLTIESIHNELSHRVDSHAVFQLYSFADMFTLSSDISVYEAFPNDGILQPRVSIDSFKMEFYLKDYMTITFGKYVYHLGQSEFFNPLYTFYQPDATALFFGAVERIHHPELLTQISFHTHDFSLNITFSPFLPTYRPFPIDSAWFPKKDIPEVLPFARGDKALGIIEYSNIESSKSSIEDEYSIQVGFSGFLPNLDWTMFWYSGWNRTFPLEQKMTAKPRDPIFDIYLSPVYEKINSIGLSLSTVLSRTRFFFDALLTPESTFSTPSYIITGSLTKIEGDQTTEFAKNIRYTAGLSIDIYEFNMFIQAEYANIHIFEAEEKRIISPHFSHTLSGMIYISNNSRSIALNTISIISMHDFSILLYPSVSLELSQEFSAGISTPFFFGRTTSEFGQYQNNRAVSITCTIRF